MTTFSFLIQLYQVFKRYKSLSHLYVLLEFYKLFVSLVMLAKYLFPSVYMWCICFLCYCYMDLLKVHQKELGTLLDEKRIDKLVLNFWNSLSNLCSPYEILVERLEECVCALMHTWINLSLFFLTRTEVLKCSTVKTVYRRFFEKTVWLVR